MRGLLRAPGYALATTLTLALGLGGAVTVLALGAGVLRPLPCPESVFGVPPTDVVTYVAAGGLVLAVAAAALWTPARLAARTDPAAALRGD